jgi:methyl-accepting chemotaxis protein
VTQQNASMVNQTSSAASQMRELAEHLSELIDAFELGADAGQDSGQQPTHPMLSGQ